MSDVWLASAACRGGNPDLFFAGEGAPRSAYTAGRAICAGCPVRVECLDAAVAAGERYGLWGGMSPKQRVRAAAAARRVAA